MTYDIARLVFCSIILILGIGLVVTDYARGRRLKKKGTQPEHLKFGPLEVTSSSIGLVLIVLSVGILLVSRVEREQTEFRARAPIIEKLRYSHITTINALFDCKVDAVKQFIQREWKPAFLKKFYRNVSRGQQLSAEKQILFASDAAAAIQAKQEELTDAVNEQRAVVVRSADEFIRNVPLDDLSTGIETVDARLQSGLAQAESIASKLQKIEKALNEEK